MRNSERPEQGEWAKRMTALLDGPVEYHDCDDVTLMLDGGSDDAGFVQVIRGKVDDPHALKSLMGDTDMLHELRPEILGATLAIEADGTFTETVAFTDEASARNGEGKEMPEMPAEVRETLDASMQGATFYDLHHPWFASGKEQGLLSPHGSRPPVAALAGSVATACSTTISGSATRLR